MVGDVTYFLSLQVKKMKLGILVSQRNYARNIVKKYIMERKKCTPISNHVKLSKDEKGVIVDQSLYKIMIDILISLSSSLLYITFSVGVSTCVRSNPITTNPTQVKIISKNIWSQSEIMLGTRKLLNNHDIPKKTSKERHAKYVVVMKAHVGCMRRISIRGKDDGKSGGFFSLINLIGSQGKTFKTFILCDISVRVYNNQVVIDAIYGFSDGDDSCHKDVIHVILNVEVLISEKSF